MADMAAAKNVRTSAVLIVDADIVSRHAIADYLRDCGYMVVEAASSHDTMTALDEPYLSIDIALIAVADTETCSVFELAYRVRSKHPAVTVKLAVSIERAAQFAAELCDIGPHLGRPYDPQMVADFIKRTRASVLSEPT